MPLRVRVRGFRTAGQLRHGLWPLHEAGAANAHMPDDGRNQRRRCCPQPRPSLHNFMIADNLGASCPGRLITRSSRELDEQLPYVAAMIAKRRYHHDDLRAGGIILLRPSVQQAMRIRQCMRPEYPDWQTLAFRLSASMSG